MRPAAIAAVRWQAAAGLGTPGDSAAAAALGGALHKRATAALAAAHARRGLSSAPPQPQQPGSHRFELTPGCVLSVVCSAPGSGVRIENGPHDVICVAGSPQLAVAQDGATIGTLPPLLRVLACMPRVPARLAVPQSLRCRSLSRSACFVQCAQAQTRPLHALPDRAAATEPAAAATVRVQLPQRFCGLSVATAGGAVELAGQLVEAPLDVRSAGGECLTAFDQL